MKERDEDITRLKGGVVVTLLRSGENLCMYQ